MIKIFIEQRMELGETQLFILDEDENGRNRSIAKPMNIEFIKIDPFKNERVEPTLRFNYIVGDDFLKGLSEALIRCGFRDPVTSQKSEIKRLENHLEDMRKFAFKLVDEPIKKE